MVYRTLGALSLCGFGSAGLCEPGIAGFIVDGACRLGRAVGSHWRVRVGRATRCCKRRVIS